jgi:hypothetical protein
MVHKRLARHHVNIIITTMGDAQSGRERSAGRGGEWKSRSGSKADSISPMKFVATTSDVLAAR